MQRSIQASITMLTECYRQFDEGSDAYTYYVKLAAEGGRNLQAYDDYQQRGEVGPGLDGITPPSREQAAQYEVLRQQITANGDFKYTRWEALNDDLARYQVGERAGGALQAGLSAAGMAASGALAVTTAETGIGPYLARGAYVANADQASAGLMTLINGQPQPTLGGKALTQLGMNPDIAEMVYGLGTGAADATQ